MTASFRVVQTSTQIPVGPSDLTVFDGLDVDFEAVHAPDERTVLEATRDADAVLVLVEDFPRHVIENLRAARSITRYGIGYDTIDVAAATDRGIWVTNVPDANYREVAVHAIALALAVTRRLPALDRGIRSEGWASALAPGVHRPDVQTFGLLGLGRIGRRTAEVARALGYTVVAHDPAVDPGPEGVELVGFDELVARSDVLSLHVPLSESTRDVIDAAVLARMRPGSVLVNVSRGGLVDEHALADALVDGHLFGAGLDAFAHEPLEDGSPLRGLDSVILTPHAAHWSEESWAEVRSSALADVARVLRGEEPRSPVNRPQPLRRVP
ncbi:C-terminal binding protein [Pseudonocardia kujensis]|uniref:C-terminal binding protein n=1 Tax=Pseudonocardia kujensis TaxID=1128675 RepID=UPI001E4C7109|nr:C-terminal binding protein [Pseudonocardia kujensis]MCE0764585.1 C-terminal binding protein [Pseudonocardia kujensis]